MKWQTLRLKHFRNIESLEIHPAEHINCIVGENGSGKTSILEAIAFLGSGKSFRDSVIKSVIRKDQEETVLFGMLKYDGIVKNIGMVKTPYSTRVRINGQNLKSASELANIIPIQLIHPESQAIINGGPKDRRRFLDWGVFHVEQQFPRVYKEFRQVLKQRNAALHDKNKELVQIWDDSFIQLSMEIYRYRKHYLIELLPYIKEYLTKLTRIEDIHIGFEPGWEEGTGLAEQLDAVYFKDLKLQYTSLGPQRADLILTIDGTPLEKWCSRGQQKIIASAMLLAQMSLMKEDRGKDCILLIDDLPAELDEDNRRIFLDTVEELNLQTFITATSPNLLESATGRWFHVKHGCLQKVV